MIFLLWCFRKVERNIEPNRKGNILNIKERMKQKLFSFILKLKNNGKEISIYFHTEKGDLTLL